MEKEGQEWRGFSFTASQLRFCCCYFSVFFACFHAYHPFLCVELQPVYNSIFSYCSTCAFIGRSRQWFISFSIFHGLGMTHFSAIRHRLPLDDIPRLFTALGVDNDIYLFGIRVWFISAAWEKAERFQFSSFMYKRIVR
ncbi:hypothetical protein DL95DRAFT_108457 [Leptodontidium sp. 2 PMI_412]|nr:hypothetical protein DL95DRAFT_108457 [Leptodontidium sp. 2 PMI_412]